MEFEACNWNIFFNDSLKMEVGQFKNRKAQHCQQKPEVLSICIQNRNGLECNERSREGRGVGFLKC